MVHRKLERRDNDGKRNGVLVEEKCALRSEKLKYFKTKFESYIVNYFGTEGVIYFESNTFRFYLA